jgi:hypothetical protein
METNFVSLKTGKIGGTFTNVSREKSMVVLTRGLIRHEAAIKSGDFVIYDRKLHRVESLPQLHATVDTHQVVQELTLRAVY